MKERKTNAVSSNEECICREMECECQDAMYKKDNTMRTTQYIQELVSNM